MRRRVFIVIAAALGFAIALNALVYSLYRSEVRAVRGGLDQRLTALGTTAASWFATTGEPEQIAGLLATLVADNKLEDAYVLDPSLRVVAGVHTRASTPLNLLRVDEVRLAAALDGRGSVGSGYSIGQTAVEVAYFPFFRDRQHHVLALEAGDEYHAPARRLRATYAFAVALTILVALVFAAGLVLALRALERARIAYGRAERLAAVGQMAAMVAHEVRNPLGILRGQVELARERLPSDAPERERERHVEMLAEIERLNKLTDEFLALARDVPLERESVRLGALVSALADAVRIASPSAKLECRVIDDVEISADAPKLRRAVHNLVLNALQVGGEDVRVVIEVAAAQDRARITVSDDGPGVPAELAAHLTEPFITGRPGGSGLGLAVARRVAESHGGTFAFESAAGVRGARFSIYLPDGGSR
ncbi:MAG TPA: ATP-binding protein [Kofleriaceae bacterium]